LRCGWILRRRSKTQKSRPGRKSYAYAIIFAIFFGLLVSKKMLIPITEITNTAQNISINDLSRRIDANGPDDDLTTLARTFNELIGRLQSSFQSQNQFVSDASHELRPQSP
jgi:two-component system sensor histidine kinase ArlS